MAIFFRHPELWPKHAHDVRPEMFETPEYQAVARAIDRAYTKTKRISYTGAFAQLRVEPNAAQAQQALIDITESPFVHESELEPLIVQLDEAYRRRQLSRALTEAHRILHNNLDLDEARAQIQQLVMNATLQQTHSHAIPIQELFDEALDALAERQAGTDRQAVSTGFHGLDLALQGGWARGDLIVLAAATSMGKTALALHFAQHVMHTAPVFIVSLEMSDRHLVDRILIASTPVSASKYNTRLSRDDHAKVRTTREQLAHLRGAVLDRRGLDIDQLVAHVRRYHYDNPDLGLVIIDYLQLIAMPSERSRTHALVVGDVVRRIRDLAGELGVPIILLSQLNRAVAARQDKRPQLYDLRDSGNIEEFADVVLFVYRPGYYDPNLDANETEVIVAKQRRGARGTTVYLRFDPHLLRFADLFDPL